jgi:hypothetical protein
VRFAEQRRNGRDLPSLDRMLQPIHKGVPIHSVGAPLVFDSSCAEA